MTNLPLRERRHQQAMADVAKLEDRREKLLDQLTRTNDKLKAARRAVTRYERAAAAPKPKPPRAAPVEPAPAPKPPRSRKPKPELPVGQPLDPELIAEVSKVMGRPPSNPVQSEEAKLAAAARMRAELASEQANKRRRS